MGPLRRKRRGEIGPTRFCGTDDGTFAQIANLSPPLQIDEPSTQVTRFIRLATFVLVAAILYVAKDVLLPVALAVLVAFLLAPFVVRLTHLGLPKAIAIFFAATVTFAAIGGVGWVVTHHALALAQKLPDYEQNLQEKIRILKSPHQPEALARTTEMVDKLRKQLDAPEPAAPGAAVAGTAAEPKPVSVAVMAAPQTQLELTRELLGPIVGPLGAAGLVIVLVIAMLFQREDLRDRLVHLVSHGKIGVGNEALGDASRRVSRYLWMQLVVNATYGIPIGIGLYLIGVPSAFLWGLIATILRFIPFIGPWIGAIFPVTLAFAIDPGWSMLLWTLGLFLAMELISNNVIEVLLYGKGTGISTLALLVGAVFWFWLWGLAGLVLATPLTVCLLVIGKYVPSLRFLSMVLGSESTVDPPTRFYQRMLAEDTDHVVNLASEQVEKSSLAAFFDNVFVPALLLSEIDRHQGDLPLDRQAAVFRSSRQLIDELDRRREADSEDETVTADPPVRLLIVPAGDDADEIVGRMLRSLLRVRGIGAEVTPVGDSAESCLSRLRETGAQAFCVSALPPSTLLAARQTSRRLRMQARGVPILMGVWAEKTPASELQTRLTRNDVVEVVTTLTDAVDRLEKLLVTGTTARPFPVPPATGDEKRAAPALTVLPERA